VSNAATILSQGFGWLCLHGWHGTSYRRVEVVGETPKRFRIRAIDETRLAGRRRFLAPGEEALVPKTALWPALPQEACNGATP